MPNWVYNKIIIVGPDPEVRSIYDLVRDQLKGVSADPVSVLKHHFPLPDGSFEEHEGVNKDGVPYHYRSFTDQGYQDAISLWGTKWADCDTAPTTEPVDLSNGWTELRLSCTSAWSPPLAGFRALSEKLGLVIGISFEEEQPDFIGFEIFVNGESVYVHEITGATIDASIPPYPTDGTDEDENNWWQDRNEIISEYRTIVDDHLERVLKRFAGSQQPATT